MRKNIEITASADRAAAVKSASGLVFRVRPDGGLRRIEPDLRMRPVAEGLRCGSAATAERHGTTADLVFGPVPIDHSHVLVVDHVGSVLAETYRRHHEF